MKRTGLGFGSAAMIFIAGALASACSGKGATDSSAAGNTGTATVTTAALTGGATEGTLNSEGSFGISSGEAATGATDSGVAKAGGNRAFGSETYLNNSTEVDTNNRALAGYMAASGDEAGYAAVQSVINVNAATASLYSMVVAKPAAISGAGQATCTLPSSCGGTPPTVNPSVCNDAFYSQANSCQIMMNYLCAPDETGKIVCNLPCGSGDKCALDSDSGNLMTCGDPAAFTTCCAYTCSATSPGCYTPGQQVEKSIGQYGDVAEPTTGIVSLDRSSTLGQLNFKESHIAYFSRDAAPTSQPMRRISTNCGVELEVTPTHTFVNIDGTIKLASSYNVGDLMLTEDGSFCEVTGLNDYDEMHGNQKTFQAFNVAVDSDELTEQVIVARGNGHGHGILTGSHWFQDHDTKRFGRALAREQIHAEIKP